MSIRVIVIDDDQIKRKAIVDALHTNKDIEVIKRGKRGKEALELIKTFKPKVLVIGDQLSDMSGYAFIKEVMKELPLAILVVTDEEKDVPVDYPEALDYGIVDSLGVIIKEGKVTFPRLVGIRLNILTKLNIDRFRAQIDQINKYKKRSYGISALSQKKKAKLERIREAVSTDKMLEVSKKKMSFTPSKKQKKIIVIGASTGGPKMLIYIISQFPPNFPPVLVVQHMPKGFIAGFAERMNQNARMNVQLADDGMIVKSGNVYIAPGGYHMEIDRSSGVLRIRITDGAKVNFVKPAVDVTLFSAAREFESGVIGVILTGMGSDGREGARVTKKVGGTVLALNEEDSIIYGMNKAVIDAGLADEILGMDAIVKTLGRAIHKKPLES
ncbi:MAG: chemotaxis protein CheB [Candidatus Kariarchaeaceae archaeon]